MTFKGGDNAVMGVTTRRARAASRGALLGGLTAIALGASAHAQSASASYSIVDSPDVALQPNKVNVNATLGTVYDNNVPKSSAALAALRGLKVDDIIVTPSAVVDIFRNFGRESAYLVGSAGYNFYDRNSKLDRENIDLSGGVNGQFGACRATASGDYSRRQDSLEDVTRTRVQDVYDIATVGLDATCGRAIGLAPIASVAQTWSNNSLSQLNTSDYKTFSTSGGVAYRSPSFGTLSFFGDYSKTDFINRFLPINGRPIEDGFEVYGGGVKFDRTLGARIQGVASISYSSVNPTVAGTGGFDGLTYSADLTFRANSRMGLHGNFSRAVLPSNVLNSTYRLETQELVEGTYKIGGRLVLALGASDVVRDFKGRALVQGLDLNHDELKAVYATATYRLRKIFLALDLRNEAGKANVDAFNYSDTRVGLTVGTSF